jgi:hypothetical protein
MTDEPGEEEAALGPVTGIDWLYILYLVSIYLVQEADLSHCVLAELTNTGSCCINRRSIVIQAPQFDKSGRAVGP